MGRESFSHFAQVGVALGRAVAVPTWTSEDRSASPDALRRIAASLDRAAGLVGGPIAIAGHRSGGWLAMRLADPRSPLTDAARSRITANAALSPVRDLGPLADPAGSAPAKPIGPDADASSPAYPGIPTDIWMASKAPSIVQS